MDAKKRRKLGADMSPDLMLKNCQALTRILTTELHRYMANKPDCPKAVNELANVLVDLLIVLEKEK